MIKNFPEDDLKQFVDEFDKVIWEKEEIEEFIYPQEFYGQDVSAKQWDNKVKDIRKTNKDLLKRISQRAGVYVLYTKSLNGTDWEVVYIGQTCQKYSRNRISNHLIKKSSETRAKLSNVQNAIKNGSRIGLVFIEVNPPALRHYVEESIITLHPELPWNTHMTKPTID